MRAASPPPLRNSASQSDGSPNSLQLKNQLSPQVLAEFPMELVSAVVAGRWAASAHPFRPWLAGYCARLGLAAARCAQGAVQLGMLSGALLLGA